MKDILKSKKTVEEKVHNVLSDRRMVLKLALLSLIESMKNNPDKYSRMIYHNAPSAANYNSQYYDTDSYGQQQQQYPSHAYTDMLLDEAEKLYGKLAKEMVNDIIADYSSNISSSLPLLSPPEEREGNPTIAANHTHMYTGEHRLFIQSEINDDN